MNNPELSEEEKAFSAHLTFCVRSAELQTIRKHLLSNPPHNCAIIGETSFGKTTLLRYLADPANTPYVDDLEIYSRFTFIYLDCNIYISLARMFHGKRAFASAQFWWDLYSATVSVLKPDVQPVMAAPKWNSESTVAEENKARDEAYEIKYELETLLRGSHKTAVIILDNFEGVASLPLRDSEWLRSLTQRLCNFIVSSRYRLYLLYHPEGEPENSNQLSQITTSPLWNLFSDPIYLGLIDETDAEVFLWRAYQLARAAGSLWEAEDIAFIRKVAGRHPKLLRISCNRLFEWRMQHSRQNDSRGYEYLRFTISQEANAICQHLWQSLKDKELEDELRIVHSPAERTAQPFALPQKELIAIAKGRACLETDVTFVLEQRGLIEWVDGCWRVFSEIMQQFVLNQEAIYARATIASEPEISSLHSFTKLEGQVYAYLLKNAGKVCSKEDIKSAIWQGKKNEPGDSALQKIIERIRDKIEHDEKQPQYLLISVRGQGYMLRRDVS